MMTEPFFLAKATSSVSWARVAAAPVGLFGEQKKRTSVLLACAQQGTKQEFFGQPLNENHVPANLVAGLLSAETSGEN